MNDAQKKILELVGEMDSVCQSNSIDYFFYGRSLLQVLRDGAFDENDHTINVLIRARDCKKFISAMESQMGDDRFIEYMGNNSHFPGFSIHYGNSQTMDVDVRNWNRINNNGLRIIIRILRAEENSKLSQRYNSFLESAWKMGGNPRTVDQNQRRFYSIQEKKFERKGRDVSGRELFDKLIRAGSKNSSRVFVKRPRRSGRDYYDADLFAKPIWMDFEGTKVPVPCGYNKVVETIYGLKWAQTDYLNEYNPILRIVDAEVPFNEFFRELEKEGIDIEEMQKSQDVFIEERNRFSSLNKEIKNAWNKLYFAGDRINLWEYYNDKKDELNELRRANNVDGMIRILDPYIESADKYLKYGLGMYFDEEIFEHLEFAMNAKGKNDFCVKIKDSFPSQLDVPIKIVTHDGKPI